MLQTDNQAGLPSSQARVVHSKSEHSDNQVFKPFMDDLKQAEPGGLVEKYEKNRNFPRVLKS